MPSYDVVTDACRRAAELLEYAHGHFGAMDGSRLEHLRACRVAGFTLIDHAKHGVNQARLLRLALDVWNSRAPDFDSRLAAARGPAGIAECAPWAAANWHALCARVAERYLFALQLSPGLFQRPAESWTEDSATADTAESLVDVFARASAAIPPSWTMEIAFAHLDREALALRNAAPQNTSDQRAEVIPSGGGYQAVAPSHLAQLLAWSADTVRARARACGVRIGARGERGFKFPQADAVLICEHVRDAYPAKHDRACSAIDIILGNTRK